MDLESLPSVFCALRIVHSPPFELCSALIKYKFLNDSQCHLYSLTSTLPVCIAFFINSFYKYYIDFVTNAINLTVFWHTASAFSHLCHHCYSLYIKIIPYIYKNRIFRAKAFARVDFLNCQHIIQCKNFQPCSRGREKTSKSPQLYLKV